MALSTPPAAHMDRYCGALNRKGQPCRREAGWGTDHFGVGRCKHHLGSTRNHRIGAKRILTERRVQSELGALLDELELDEATVDPLDVLSEQMVRASAMVSVIGAMVGALPMRGAEHDAEGRTVTSGMFGPDHQGDGRPHVLMAMYGEWIERAGKLAKLAKDAGLEERRVQMTEAQSEEQGRVLRNLREFVLATPREELEGAFPTLVRKAIETTSREGVQ